MNKTKFEIVLSASAPAIASVIEKKDPHTNSKDFGETIFIAEALAAMGDDAPTKYKYIDPQFPNPFEYILSLPVNDIATLYFAALPKGKPDGISAALIAMGDD